MNKKVLILSLLSLVSLSSLQAGPGAASKVLAFIKRRPLLIVSGCLVAANLRLKSENVRLHELNEYFGKCAEGHFDLLRQLTSKKAN